jgi:HEAT repeat protein
MDRLRQHLFSSVLIGITVGMAAGCGSLPMLDLGAAFQMPWAEEPDRVPGLRSPAERLEALEQLAANADDADPARHERVAGELAKMIRDEADPVIRAEIIRTVGHYQGRTADEVLRRALKDSDAAVRVAACEAWGRRNHPESAKILAKALATDTDVDVRLAAARALGETEDPAAVQALGLALDDRDPAMQYRAVQSLEEVTGEDLGNDVDRWRQYVRGELPESERGVSVAERLGGFF